MSYQSITETSTWQYTTLTRDRQPPPSEIQTRNLNKWAAAGTHLSLCGHWDWPFWHLVDKNTVLEHHCATAQNVCLSDVYGSLNLAYKWQIRGENLSCTNVQHVQKLKVWKLRTACIQVLSQRIKWPGLRSEGDRSPPYSAKVNNDWSYRYTSPHMPL